MTIILVLLIFVLGSLFGSFINCLVWRLHEKDTIMGRSYCPKCKHMIAWYDNIPLFSFLALKGKCRHCGKKISWQYPVVEFVTGILFVVAAHINIGTDLFKAPIFELQASSYVVLLRDWFIICVMVVIFIYDLRWYLILDIVSLPAVLVIFLLNMALGFDLLNILISGIIGGSFFLFQFVISRGKWIGGGDIRLGLLMGVALGWPKILLAIMIAYLIGSVFGIFLLVTKKKSWGSQLPLGVFLTPATLIVLFWGKEILSWYLKLIGF